jgi:3-dehydroquinate synthase
MKAYELSVAGSPVVVNKPFNWLQEFLEAHCASGSVHILCDTNTAIHCLPLLPFSGNQIKAPIIIPTGEENKTIASCEMIWAMLSEQGADRHSTLITLGGGMITDIGGFCAATYMRGIRFIHLPTSLLAMCDAALGGKHGVDFKGLKNYIGLFSRPELIYINTVFLQTLPEKHIRNGMAEIVKASVVGDPVLFSMLEENQTPRLIKDEIIYRAIQVKKKFVEEDYHDKGNRAALNFGHTIGHAIESFFLNREKPFLHGECIAIGMMVETMLSNRILGFPDRNTCDRILDLIRRTTPVNHFTVSVGDISGYLSMDKKMQDGTMRFALIKGIGEPVIGQQVSVEMLAKLMNDEEIAGLIPWLRPS